MAVRDVEASAPRWGAPPGAPVPDIAAARPGVRVKAVRRGKRSPARPKPGRFRMGEVALGLVEPAGKASAWTERLNRCGESLQPIGRWVAHQDGGAARMDMLGVLSAAAAMTTETAGPTASA